MTEPEPNASLAPLHPSIFARILKFIYAIRWVLIVVAVLLCINFFILTKTKSWDEEVLLNTGEVIWIKRSQTFNYGSAGDNPFKFGYYPERDEEIKFTWNGKKYYYKGSDGIFLLVISPENFPIFVAVKGVQLFGYHNDETCSHPNYKMMLFDDKVENWIYIDFIEPWLYEMPKNLLINTSDMDGLKSKYTMQEKPYYDARISQGIKKVDAGNIGSQCERFFKVKKQKELK